MPQRRRTALILLLLFSLSSLVLNRGQAQPLQRITILSPGENSVVTEPIHLSAMVYPGADDLIRVALVDKQQNLLARQLIRIDAPKDTLVEFSTELAFDISGETIAAILTVGTQDELHRPLALRSVVITLKSDGQESIQPQPLVEPWLTVTRPLPNAVITESPIMLEGTVVPISGNPVNFELATERGVVISSRQLAVDDPGVPIDFQINLVYMAVTNDQEMRVVIRQSGDIPGVDAILDSLPITIIP